MRVLVFGAGAVGSVVAALLSARHEVDVAVRGDRAERIAREGITIRGMVERTVRPVTRPNGSYDIVFITTKAYDTAAAVDEATPFTDDDTVVVSLQNGMDNIDLLEDRFGDRAVVGLTTMGATRVDPVTVRLVDRGRSVVGSPAGSSERARAVASLLKDAGLEGAVTENVRAEVWMKVIINASINPLAALAGTPNGHIVEHPPLLELSRQACAEAVRAAEAHGIVLPAPDAFSRVKEVIWATRSNRCSMLQDLEAGRRTESDEISGALVRRGEAAGISMAVNRGLWTLVRAAEGRPINSGST